MWTGSTQVMMPLAKDASSQFKSNRVEVRILFCLFRAFPKDCATQCSHCDFFLFGVKWYIKDFFNAFD